GVPSIRSGSVLRSHACSDRRCTAVTTFAFVTDITIVQVAFRFGNKRTHEHIFDFVLNKKTPAAKAELFQARAARLKSCPSQSHCFPEGILILWRATTIPSPTLFAKYAKKDGAPRHGPTISSDSVLVQYNGLGGPP